MMGAFLLAFVALAATITGAAQASPVFAHTGSADPTTEGWTVEPSFAPYGRPTSATVSNDQGTGYDAWSIDDNLTTIGSNWLYTQTPTSRDNELAMSFGWTLRARIRLGDAPDEVGNAGAVMLEYANSMSAYRLALGAEADGDPIALLWDGGVASGGSVATGTRFTLQGGGAGYHLYELVYDPIAASVDLFIDGTETISNYAGVQSNLFNRVAWGSGSSSDTGQSYWNLIEWEVLPVPLPASLPIFSAGLACFGWMGKQRR